MDTVLYAQLQPFGALLWLQKGPPLALPTWEEAAQLAAEVESPAAQTGARELAQAQRAALDDFQHLRAECKAAEAWSRQGQRFGQDTGYTQAAFAAARAQALRLETLGRAALAFYVRQAADPALALEMGLPVPQSGLELFALERRRALLRAGMPTDAPIPQNSEGRWVIGCDPGVRTGLALVCGEVLIESAVADSLLQTYTICQEWLERAAQAGGHAPTLVVERFANLQFMNNERKASLWQEGLAHFLAEVFALEIVEQSPQVVAALVERGAARLAARYDRIPKTAHERDALAHACVYLQGLVNERPKRRRR